MNLFALLNMLIMFTFGTAVLYYISKHWKDENKKQNRISELIYGIMYFIVGIMIYSYLELEQIAPTPAFAVQAIMFTIFMIFFIILLPFNIWKSWYNVKKHPELLTNDPVMTRNYAIFLADLSKKYAQNSKNDDFVKDFTRKVLHIVMLGIIIGAHTLSYSIAPQLASWGLTPLAFRNTLYYLAGSFFLFMFTLEDLYRMSRFQDLPNWARKWLKQSLDPRSEAWTFISSVPFLLSVFMFVFAPVQILFTAAVVSCVGDSMASLIGKSMGKHKLTWSFHPKKTMEGLIAGITSTLISVVMIFIYFPIPNMTPLLIFGLGLLAAAIFALIDCFARYLVDNISNTIFPALAVWFVLTVFL